jgi:hypothetical protein
MALINITIPGLYGGVSQQAPEMRYDTQVTEMINCYPTLIGGVSKRPPASLIKADSTFPTDAFVYTYDRGSGNEKYIITINSDSQYRIFDLVTNDWVTDWETQAYLAIPEGTSPKDAFAMTTVGDTTFVVNKTVTCEAETTLEYNDDPDWDSTFFYWVKRTSGGAVSPNTDLRYTYYIYNSVGTKVGETTSHNSTVAATNLASDIGGSSKGSVVRKTSAAGYAGSDSWGNQASESWVGKVKSLQDLPNELGFENTVIEIAGDDNNAFDSYYVKYADGVYKETYRPGICNELLAATLPHRIGVRRGGTLESPIYYDLDESSTGGNYFDTVPYADRTVGDEESASVPSFIGSTINDVFFYRNRLGFISGDNVILSEVGEYYNFFPTTVTTIVDSDPIDVAVDSNQAITLLYAIPYNKELLIFGDKAQFVMSGGDTLTPNKVSVQQSTAFQIKNTAPIAMGPNVYFATEKNDFSSIREYFVQPNTSVNDAADITAHCPNYVPKNVIKLVGSSQNDMLFVLSAEEPNSIYVYNFYWNGDQKAQSAWHKWVFEDTVFNIEVIGSTLYLMTTDGAETPTQYLLGIPLEYKQNFKAQTYYDKASNPYTSTIVLSEMRYPGGEGKVDDTRGTFTIKNITVEADYNSLYKIVAFKKKYNSRTYYNSTSQYYPLVDTIQSKGYIYETVDGMYPTSTLYPDTDLYPGAITYSMPTDNKYTVLGNTNNIEIAITNDIAAGFKINSLNIAGDYIRNSTRVQ